MRKTHKNVIVGIKVLVLIRTNQLYLQLQLIVVVVTLLLDGILLIVSEVRVK